MPHEFRWDVVGTRFYWYVFTMLLVVVSLVSIATKGFNFGIDFAGGVLIEARAEQVVDVAKLREELGGLGLGEIGITSFGDTGKDVMIRVAQQEGGDAAQTAALKKVQGELAGKFEIRKTDVVGPKVGAELIISGALASALALIAIAIYVWFRFEVKFGTGAFVTTFHDVYAVVGLFSITQLTFDLTIVAGVLTVAGYSINDTVVVYDRIREMLKKYKKLPITEVIDISITSTLSRTVMTSLATMMAAGAMCFLGGPVLFGFAVSIMFGIIIGTYSSIFVAAPMLIHLPGRLPGYKYTGTDTTAKAAS